MKICTIFVGLLPKPSHIFWVNMSPGFPPSGHGERRALRAAGLPGGGSALGAFGAEDALGRSAGAAVLGVSEPKTKIVIYIYTYICSTCVYIHICIYV